MPELPEVETIRAQLATALVGQRLCSIEALWPKSLETRGILASSCYDKPVEAVWRRGKMLGIALEGGISVLVHLRMTGQLLYLPVGSNQGARQTTRVRMEFASGDVLLFNDQRKFGRVVVTKSSEVGSDGLLATMGPEALGAEFTSDVLKKAGKRHTKLAVKALILDQRVVAGVGNIYADEALWTARIHPERVCGTLSEAEWGALRDAIVAVLREGVVRGGSTLRDYVDAAGQAGTYLEVAKVFARTGKPCLVCSTPVTKIRVAGRGTHLCTSCQVQEVAF